jgi:hypothetical protein
MNVCMCMHVCMCVCMYACMYACMCVYDANACMQQVTYHTCHVCTLTQENVCTDNYWSHNWCTAGKRSSTVVRTTKNCPNQTYGGRQSAHRIIQLCNCSALLDFVLVRTRRCWTLGANLATVLQLATVLLMFHHEL